MGKIEVHFTVPGEPRAKARPRFSRKTGHTYTPDKTVEYEELIRLRYLQATDKVFPDDAEINAVITAYFSIPKSASKKKKQAMLEDKIRPTKKPDVDNIMKIILDSLQVGNTAFRDDAQVVWCVCEKFYDDVPRVEVSLYERE